MTTQTITLGKHSLLDLYGNLEIKITKLCGKRKTKLFCKKYEALITTTFNEEHHCLKPKRIYTNKEGKEIVIFCPHLMTLSGDPFYKQHESLIYESLEGIFEINPQFKERVELPKIPEKLEVFEKTEEAVNKIKKAYHELQGSA